MKVRIAHPPDIPTKSGVYTWSETVRQAMVANGHKLWRDGCGCTPDVTIGSVGLHLEPKPVLGYLQVCHGIVEPERPPSYPRDSGAKTAYVSEEARDYWSFHEGYLVQCCAPSIAGKCVCPIILQPINLDFWKPDPSVRQRKRIVRYGYYKGCLNETLQWLAPEIGYQYEHVSNATHHEARAKIREAALVIASGRSALEAAACGVPVLLADDRFYNEQGGLIEGPLADVYPTSNLANFSGRAAGHPVTESFLQCEIRVAIESGPCRYLIEENHDSRKIAEQLLEAAVA